MPVPVSPAPSGAGGVGVVASWPSSSASCCCPRHPGPAAAANVSHSAAAAGVDRASGASTTTSVARTTTTTAASGRGVGSIHVLVANGTTHHRTWPGRRHLLARAGFVTLTRHQRDNEGDRDPDLCGVGPVSWRPRWWSTPSGCPPAPSSRRVRWPRWRAPRGQRRRDRRARPRRGWRPPPRPQAPRADKPAPVDDGGRPSRLARAALGPGVLEDPAARAVLSDFDGTLAPIVARPRRRRSAARARPGSWPPWPSASRWWRWSRVARCPSSGPAPGRRRARCAPLSAPTGSSGSRAAGCVAPPRPSRVAPAVAAGGGGRPGRLRRRRAWGSRTRGPR